METVEQARERLLMEVVDGEAVTCPCCSQLAKLYQRTIYASMAKDLIEIYRRNEAVYLPSISSAKGGDIAKLRHWELIEEIDGDEDKRLWRITQLGRDFVERKTKVPKYARLYNNVFIELGGEPVDIDAVLGKKFDYDELMNR